MGTGQLRAGTCVMEGQSAVESFPAGSGEESVEGVELASWKVSLQSNHFWLGMGRSQLRAGTCVMEGQSQIR